MWTTHFRYFGNITQYGSLSGCDIGEFAVAMPQVTLVRADVSLITHADAPQSDEKRLISGQ